MSRKPILVLATLLICAMSFAQVLRQPIAADPAREAAALAAQKAAALTPATSTCAFTFTAAGTAAQKYIQFCVTVNGNVTEFQSPSGIEYIRIGAYNEGYGICDGPGVSNARYFDWADGGDSGNWLAPVTLSSGLTSVKIARTTSDGVWTLTQTFTLDKKATGADVTMALKNNTAVNRSVYLVRFADVDANNNISNNNFDGTADSAWGYYGNPAGFTGYGLMLTRNGPDPFFHQGFAIHTPVPPDPCNSGINFGAGLRNVDGGIIAFDSISIPKGGTKTVKLKYQGF